ncbi:unnamed protein product [Prorocentrum cordatum]|uniref:Subtilisin n=1 Tax=Prorocentrum cordatum TaxID=2364126 RepID=A0ABN9SI42_9DINO|nr:unnamed protein product [Polarella glacialis]
MEALLEVGMCLVIAGGGNSETVCIAGLAPVQLVSPTQFAGLRISFGPVEAGATTLNLSAELEDLLEVGMCLVIAGGGNSETVCIAGLAPVQLVSPTQFAYPAGSTLTLLDGAGATTLNLSAELEDLLEVGMCLVIAGGGNKETVCIAGLAPVQLVSPTQFAYPAGATTLNLSAELEDLLEVGMCLVIAGGGNSETVCIAGLAPVQLVSPTQFAYPGIRITFGPVEAGATTLNLSAELEDLLEVGMCFTLAGGGNSEPVCIAGLAPVQLVSPTQLAYPAGSAFTLLEGAYVPSNTTMIIHGGSRAAPSRRGRRR